MLGGTAAFTGGWRRGSGGAPARSEPAYSIHKINSEYLILNESMIEQADPATDRQRLQAGFTKIDSVRMRSEEC